jgi:glutamate/tyrosine decarboxylase-like PLP-dependent enzyme
MVFYGSSETHNCVIKGIESIGVGGENFRKIPVDEHFRVRLDILESTIKADRAAGLQPFCLIGNAGTVNTGAIDDLAALAAIAKREKLWYHIDGAFGAVPRILTNGSIRKQLDGLELSDSVSFDFHKWFYVNYEVGCLLVKDAAVHKAAFSYSVNYLVKHERGLSGGPDPFANYGIELSRGFKALKVWMLLKEHGLNEYARQVQQNLDQAAYLGELVEQQPELELLAEVSLNIVCFRYKSADVQDLNALNKELLMRMHEEGSAAPSYTILNGQYAIRAAITNHRSRRSDFEALVEASVRIGREISKKY